MEQSDKVDACAASEFHRIHAQQKIKGLSKYGRPVHAFNGRDAGSDCAEELVDAFVYLTQMREEMEHYQRVCRQQQILIGHAMALIGQSKIKAEAKMRWQDHLDELKKIYPHR